MPASLDFSDFSDASDDVFALLDDCSASGERSSRLYTGWRRTLICSAGQSHDTLFDAMEEALAQGLHAVALFSYEFGYALQRLPFSVNAGAADETLASVLLFERCERLSNADVTRWLCGRSCNAPQAITGMTLALSEAEFTAAVETIQRYIVSGDTYQANFSFPLRFDMHGDPVALYVALRARQAVPYGALMRLPDGGAVLSLSPELFVSHAQGRFTCKPMKGTAQAGGDDAADLARADALRQSPKERAENLMIVDLLRNDLGRIAATGSVRVPELFAVERFGDVLQMTSTIEASARADLCLSQVFEALYPCGSITGAPKRRTMQLLQQLERWPRRLYTGAIGWFEPVANDRSGSGSGLSEFVLSVPIRTLLLEAADSNGRRRGEMGVGAGIVYDSDARAEYQECLLKARFLTGIAPGFALFETLLAEREGCRHLERHLQRLASSAEQLGFRFDATEARRRITSVCADLDAGCAYRMRLALDTDGELNIQVAAINPLLQPVRVLLSPVVMQSDDALLLHKTTLRKVYDDGWRHAEAVGAFDSLFFNERGELTEGGRSNVFVKIDGQWLTPPLSSGLLPGVMRGLLLEDPAWNARECVITRADLRAAQAVCVCNALRGVLPAEIVWDS